MSTEFSFDQYSNESLPDLSSKLVAHVREARRGGDSAFILAAAKAAADMIEKRAGACSTQEQRAALGLVQRFTYNAAADCWPGWSAAVPEIDERTVAGGLEMARRSASLAVRLGLGQGQQATAMWLIGAFELAFGRYAAATSLFSTSQQYFIAAGATGPALLAEGYIAVVERLTSAPDLDESNLEGIYKKIAAGGFEEGTAWIDQLRTALKVFSIRKSLAQSEAGNL